MHGIAKTLFWPLPKWALITGSMRLRASKILVLGMTFTLEKYVTDEAQRWSKTFPDELYQEMCRLKGWKFTSEFLAKKPSVVGHYTNDIVYARLAPGVLDALRERNPVIDEKGARARKHHQWLTEDHGHPKLREHIGNVIFLMKGTTRWDSFHRALQRSAPKLHETAELDFGDY
jgi:P63C domain